VGLSLPGTIELAYVLEHHYWEQNPVRLSLRGTCHSPLDNSPDTAKHAD
jgi:hypothetical protein